jgi:hypothetical protein
MDKQVVLMMISGIFILDYISLYLKITKIGVCLLLLVFA